MVCQKSLYVEHWTDAEIRKMRRCIAYHQHRSLRTVSADEARAVMDEQQRRRESFHGENGGRWYPGRGWLLGALGEPSLDAYHPCEVKRSACQESRD